MNINKIINEELQDITNIMSYRPDDFDSGIVNETFESQQEIRNLTIDVLKLLADYNYEKYNDDHEFNGIYGVNLNMLKNNNYGDINKYLNVCNVPITFNDSDNLNTSAEYTSSDDGDWSSERPIEVNYNYRNLKNLIEGELQKTNQIDSNSVFLIYKKVFGTHLMHEIQHFYDDFRSEGFNMHNKQFGNYVGDMNKNIKYVLDYGKYLNSKKLNPQNYYLILGADDKLKVIPITQDLVSGERNYGRFSDILNKVKAGDYNFLHTSSNYDKYYNLPNEINARFTQAINTTPQTNTLGDYVRTVLSKVSGSRKLTEKNKRHVIRKAAQFWHKYQETK